MNMEYLLPAFSPAILIIFVGRNSVATGSPANEMVFSVGSS